MEPLVLSVNHFNCGTEFLMNDALTVNTTVFVLTKGKYRPSPHNILHGRVQFINRKNRKVEPGETGLNIVVRSNAFSDFEHINGVFCFLGLDGQMKIESRGIKPELKKGSARFSLSSSDCYGFSVTDAVHEIIFTVDIDGRYFPLVNTNTVLLVNTKASSLPNTECF
jgi:hypothetical protein